MNAGDLAVEKQDNESALREYSAAAKIAESTPGIAKSRLAEMLFWHAVALVNMKRVDEALPLFARAYSLHEPWRAMVPRMPRSGLLPDDAELIARIVAAR
jgi:tetratricopeptide (TPR) repeat protein